MKYYPQWKPGSPCPNNEAVICPDHSQCSRCGWDPAVAEKRRNEQLQRVNKKRGANSGNH